ncbi:unnamed protein product [Lymnaea stagnalis]|uniref:Uncharacterized protein n=1 Tax=Lymnaea stagnalis TaxID=6523 RepID=A0AAV2HM94_LYMST
MLQTDSLITFELSHLLPYTVNKPKIRRAMIAIHRKETKIKKPFICPKADQAKCKFCKYHVEKMLSKRYKKQYYGSTVCEIKNAVFLLYCINCDEVMLSVSDMDFKSLVCINFGFHGVKNCKSEEKCHNKKYLRCMMIDHVDSDISDWVEDLQIKQYEIVVRYSFEERLLYEEYHYMDDSEVEALCPEVRSFPYDTRNVVYLIHCYNCDIKYVGKTKKTFIGRYPCFYTDKGYQGMTFHEHTEAVGSVCTFRDLRWTVIDALSDQQKRFAGKWNAVFNTCNVSIRNKIWKVMTTQCLASLKDELMENVWHDCSVDEVTDLLNDIQITRNFNEQYLDCENKKLFPTTERLFLEKREEYWMNALRTTYKLLNKIAASQSIVQPASFLGNFFKTLGNYDDNEN